MEQIFVSLDGQQTPVIVETGTLGLGQKLLKDIQTDAGLATSAALAAEEARDEAVAATTTKANINADNVTAATWRSALYLGGSAVLDVGTTTGTVAAGDDARLQAVAGKLDTATAAIDGKFKFDEDSQNWSFSDEFRQRLYLIRWKRSDNSWDDAFDLAISYMGDHGGGELVVPPLDIPLTRTVEVLYGRINVVGHGQGSSVFKVNFSGDVFRFKAASGSYLASSISNCSIDYVGVAAPTSGYAIVFDGVGDCRALSVGFNKTHKGIGFIGNNRNCRAIDCGGSDVVDAEFVINGGGNQYIKLGTTFDNLSSATSRSVRVVATERVDLDFFTSSHHGAALEIKPDTGGFVQNVFANFNDMDASNATSIVVDPSNANTVIRNLFFRGGSMSAASDVGLHIKSGSGQVGDVWLSGVMIQSNLKEGCIFEKGRIHLTDCFIARNGSNAGEPGVRLKSGVTSFQMVGGAIGPILGGPDTSARPMSLENFQLYGLVIDSGFSGTCCLSSVDLRGNVTGPIQNNSSVTIEVDNCQGYQTRATGVATIPIGVSFVSVTPPSLAKPITSNTVIIVSCLSNPDLSGVETAWRGGFTSTSFDIVTSPFLNVSGQPLEVAWIVEV